MGLLGDLIVWGFWATLGFLAGGLVGIAHNVRQTPREERQTRVLLFHFFIGGVIAATLVSLVVMAVYEPPERHHL